MNVSTAANPDLEAEHFELQLFPISPEARLCQPA